MKKPIICTAAALIAAGMICLPASADYVSEENGNIYGYSESGDTLHGRKTIDGSEYYFRADGSAVRGIVSLGGTYYRFSDKGICLGKLTGWIRKNGKRFYISDGKTLSGWQKLGNGIYYFREDGSAAVGQCEIGGNMLDFSSKGVWDGTAYDGNWRAVSDRIIKMRYDDPDNYAGSEEDCCRNSDGVIWHRVNTIYMKNPEDAEDVINELRSGYPPINVVKVKYSYSELESVWKEIYGKRKYYGVRYAYIEDKTNSVRVETDNETENLRKYIASLENNDIVNVTGIEEELYYEDE